MPPKKDRLNGPGPGRRGKQTAADAILHLGLLLTLADPPPPPPGNARLQPTPPPLEEADEGVDPMIAVHGYEEDTGSRSSPASNPTGPLFFNASPEEDER